MSSSQPSILSQVFMKHRPGGRHRAGYSGPTGHYLLGGCLPGKMNVDDEQPLLFCAVLLAENACDFPTRAQGVSVMVRVLAICSK